MNQNYVINGLRCQDHYFDVPLDHQVPDGELLSVYVREVATEAGIAQQLPYLVYFQGGPGFGAMRPMGLDGWIKEASKNYRILLLDQRGTANSSLVTAQSMAHMSSEQQAQHLSLFRADNIVRDAELIRQALIGEQTWSIIGQSFGGFCVLRYLSSAPQGLSQAFITGGIPSLTRDAKDVYQATFARVKQKNAEFFARYPQAQTMAKEIAEHLRESDEVLPNGAQLSVEYFQLLGIHLGMTGGQEALLFMMEQAFSQHHGKKALSTTFKYQMMSMLDYDTNPIFAILHESIYCQQFSSSWAAQQVRQESYAEVFNYDPKQAFSFTGEMVFPWMFEQFDQLKPLKQAAELIAHKTEWPMLYDLEVLKGNSVPVAAAIYFNDMYVDINYSLETVSQVNNVKTWVSSDFEHNGIRVDGELIFNKLYGLLNP